MTVALDWLVAFDCRSCCGSRQRVAAVERCVGPGDTNPTGAKAVPVPTRCHPHPNLHRQCLRCYKRHSQDQQNCCASHQHTADTTENQKTRAKPAGPTGPTGRANGRPADKVAVAQPAAADSAAELASQAPHHNPYFGPHCCKKKKRLWFRLQCW